MASPIASTQAGASIRTTFSAGGYIDNCSELQIGPSVTSASCGALGFNGGSASGLGVAYFGELHAQSDIASTYGRDFNPDRASSGASANFVDFLTIMLSSPNGPQPIAGFIRLSGELDGIVHGYGEEGSSAAGYASGSLQLHLDSSLGGTNCGVDMHPGLSSQKSCSAELAFAAGDSIRFGAFLTAVTDITLTSTGQFAMADFSHTGKITGITVWDANRQLLSDAILTTASGTVYGSSTVPEPASFAMLGIGVAALAIYRRYK
jgi:hypothetical protein